MPRLDSYSTVDAIASGDEGILSDVSATNATKKFTFTQVLAFIAAATSTLTNKTIDSASNTITLAASAITSGALAVARGGTGQDLSASTGLVKVAAGTVSAATLVNADVSASAAIVYSKLSLAASIVNADISVSAAIAGTKISPDFGSQNVVTTGYYGSGTTIASAGDFRALNAFLFKVRNAADSANLTVFQTDSSNNLALGSTNSQTEAFGTIRIYPTTTFRVGVGSSTKLEANTNGVGSFTNANLGVYGAGASFPAVGGGAGVFAMGNATTVPSSNPTNGVVHYAEAGAAKVRGSSGTVTTYGPADPHCPTCGRDFALEHRNDDHDEHFAICLPCLVSAVREAGVDTSKFLITEKLGPSKRAWESARAARGELGRPS